MAEGKDSGGQLTTWLCVACGNGMYTRGPTAGRLLCARCGGSVFRPFDTPAPTDQVLEDYLVDTARHLELGSASPDTRTSELRDLNRP